MGKTEAMENKRSVREDSDVKVSRGKAPETVHEIEKVGGKRGVRFGVPSHPDKSVVRPGGK